MVPFDKITLNWSIIHNPSELSKMDKLPKAYKIWMQIKIKKEDKVRVVRTFLFNKSLGLTSGVNGNILFGWQWNYTKPKTNS